MPLVLLWVSVVEVQLTFAVPGSFFLPLVALTLLLMNNRTDWVGPGFKNHPVINAILVATLLFFGYTGDKKVLTTRDPILGG